MNENQTLTEQMQELLHEKLVDKKIQQDKYQEYKKCINNFAIFCRRRNLSITEAKNHIDEYEIYLQSIGYSDHKIYTHLAAANKLYS